MSSALHQAVAARLQVSETRYTRHRRDLVDVLLRAEQPLTISEIVRVAASLPQSSVYRNLAVFEGAGVVHRIVGTGDFARFELTEELLGHHHHHLICQSCGTVADIEFPAPVEQGIEAAALRLAQRQEFQMTSHRLDLLGNCRNCSGTGSATGTPSVAP